MVKTYEKISPRGLIGGFTYSIISTNVSSMSFVIMSVCVSTTHVTGPKLEADKFRFRGSSWDLGGRIVLGDLNAAVVALLLLVGVHRLRIVILRVVVRQHGFNVVL